MYAVHDACLGQGLLGQRVPPGAAVQGLHAGGGVRPALKSESASSAPAASRMLCCCKLFVYCVKAVYAVHDACLGQGVLGQRVPPGAAVQGLHAGGGVGLKACLEVGERLVGRRVAGQAATPEHQPCGQGRKRSRKAAGGAVSRFQPALSPISAPSPRAPRPPPPPMKSPSQYLKPALKSESASSADASRDRPRAYMLAR